MRHVARLPTRAPGTRIAPVVEVAAVFAPVYQVAQPESDSGSGAGDAPGGFDHGGLEVFILDENVPLVSKTVSHLRSGGTLQAGDHHPQGRKRGAEEDTRCVQWWAPGCTDDGRLKVTRASAKVKGSIPDKTGRNQYWAQTAAMNIHSH
ncbi:hypothetical protein [Nonomuraea sp. NPDC049709]|uniref:hypothetical protein n=1 Tax=Nonomuraea sp. NPDC049709 TaxID=3154736 RepID=UPI003441CA74